MCTYTEWASLRLCHTCCTMFVLLNFVPFLSMSCFIRFSSQYTCHLNSCRGIVLAPHIDVASQHFAGKNSICNIIYHSAPNFCTSSHWIVASCILRYMFFVAFLFLFSSQLQLLGLFVDVTSRPRCRSNENRNHNNNKSGYIFVSSHHRPWAQHLHIL